MTGGSTCDSKPESYEDTAGSEEEKTNGSSSVQDGDLDKVSNLSGDSGKTDRTDVTYTRDANGVKTKQRCRVNYADSQDKSVESVVSRARNELRRPRSRGVLDPTANACKRAQWLPWNDPAFARRRSIEENKFRKHVAKDTEISQKSIVTSFKRSLKLLGLQAADLGINEDDLRDKRSETASSRGRATPTFSTQLKQRSVSLTNLRNAVQESGLSTYEAIEKMHRDVLSRAIYEEWYFRKQAEERMKKEIQTEMQKRKQEEMQWLKLEQRRKAEDNFEKWMKRKAQEIKKVKEQQDKPKILKPHSSYLESRPVDNKAFEAWKAKKDKELKAKMDMKKQIEEEEKKREEEREKKASAEAAFNAWKQQADEEFKQKIKEIERKKKEIEEKKENEMKEKKNIAISCYVTWKKKKDEELKQKTKLERLSARRAAEEDVMKKLERMYVAAQAFEEWLDHIEDREDKEKIKKMEQKYVPPWCPGGGRRKL